MEQEFITKSVKSQQLIVSNILRNIQPMVTNDEDKQEFSNRFNAILDTANIPRVGKGRQKVLSKMFGVTENGARKWMIGESIPRYEIILQIIERFKETGVTVEWLLSGNPESSPFQSKVSEQGNHYNVKDMQISAWKIPVISWVNAGNYAECIDNHIPGEADEWVGTTIKPKSHTFALVVKGDSMEPLFPEGLRIIVEPELEFIPGDYVIAKNGNEATFKQLIKDGNDYYLKPLNTRYPIKPLGESHIIGVVREAVYKFR